LPDNYQAGTVDGRRLIKKVGRDKSKDGLQGKERNQVDHCCPAVGGHHGTSGNSLGNGP